jgi:hypothetical protein
MDNNNNNLCYICKKKLFIDIVNFKCLICNKKICYYCYEEFKICKICNLEFININSKKFKLYNIEMRKFLLLEKLNLNNKK